MDFDKSDVQTDHKYPSKFPTASLRACEPRAEPAASLTLGRFMPETHPACMLEMRNYRTANFRGLVLGCIETKFCMSYAFEGSRRDLPNALLCTAL